LIILRINQKKVISNYRFQIVEFFILYNNKIFNILFIMICIDAKVISKGIIHLYWQRKKKKKKKKNSEKIKKNKKKKKKFKIY